MKNENDIPTAAQEAAEHGAARERHQDGQHCPVTKQRYSGIGGQAVIEGIMMKNGTRYAVGVRKPNGEIEVMEDRYVSLADRFPVFRLPFLRGIFSFVDSMILGMRTLTYSAGYFEDDEESEPSKLELWLDRVFGEKLEPVLMTLSMGLAVVVAVLLFVLFPAWITNLLTSVIPSRTVVSLLEGLLRVAIFVLYIRLISRAPDIRRTFEYHGAEHKCINCIEHCLPLTVDNVAASSKEHKRCGTSFIVYVMLISILLFMVIRVDGLLPKLVTRLLMIPVIAGISYEVLRFVGTHDNAVTRLLFIPGMWMQSLTTAEPDAQEIEVAIAAVERVFDWRSFLGEAG